MGQPLPWTRVSYTFFANGMLTTYFKIERKSVKFLHLLWNASKKYTHRAIPVFVCQAESPIDRLTTVNNFKKCLEQLLSILIEILSPPVTFLCVFQWPVSRLGPLFSWSESPQSFTHRL